MPHEPSGPEGGAASRTTRRRLLGILQAVAGRLPKPAGNWVADRVGDVAYVVAPRSRQAVISNLRQAMGPVPHAKITKAAHGVFRNVMRSYYDLLRAPSMRDEEIDREIDFDDVGWGRIEEIHRQGRGVILVTAHFGAFDMLTQVLARRGIPLSALIVQFKPAWVSDFISELRAARGLKLLPVDEEEGSGRNIGALKRTVALLRNGEALIVLADRNLEQQGVTVKFFGRNTVVAAGVAKMALRTRAAVVPGFGYRQRGGRYKLIFDEPIEPEGSASSNEDVYALLQRIFSRLEHYIGRSPRQWLLLQPVWPESGGRET